MGCSQSKIDNEESVLRCRERKRLMKDAVASRNAFSAAHSGYATALKSTGAALLDYGLADAAHDARSPPPTGPPAFLRPLEPLLPPPVPPPPQLMPGTAHPQPPPLQRAATMPEFAIPQPDHVKSTDTIEEEAENAEEAEEVDGGLLVRRRGRGGRAAAVVEEVVEAPPPLPKLSPEQRRPPSPPPSKAVPRMPENQDTSNSVVDFFFPPMQDMPGPSLSEIDEIKGEGQFRKLDDADVETASSMSSTVEGSVAEKVIERGPPVAKVAKKPKQGSSSGGGGAQLGGEGKRGVVVVGKSGPSVGLFQILQELDEQFLKASESAYEVSMMLEANRLHYHSNFADNRGYINHSEKLMRVITWNRSIKGLQTADDANDDFTANESLAIVLDKLLAWEKKLYDEVKAGEHMKIEYGRKVAFMNKQKKHGSDSAAYEKAKAAVTHLHTRYIVDMQSMDSTVSEISNLRDDHLYPKLVSLVDGMARMWETMNIHHRNQMKIVADIRSLDVSQTLRETTDDHYLRTAQLQDVIEGWHLQFQMLATHLRKFVAALNSWLKLNLIPIESNIREKVSSPPRVLNPPIQALIRSWNEHLEKLPFELAKNAISSFRAIILSIKEHQEDEGKLKLKCAQTRKELERKTRAFEDWYNKYAQSRMPPDGVDADIPGGAGSEDPVAKRQLEIEILKKTLEGELEAHHRHCKQVREKSLGSLKTHLPELFRALTDFSLASSEMYKRLQAVALSEKRGKRPS